MYNIKQSIYILDLFKVLHDTKSVEKYYIKTKGILLQQQLPIFRKQSALGLITASIETVGIIVSGQ